MEVSLLGFLFFVAGTFIGSLFVILFLFMVVPYIVGLVVLPIPMVIFLGTKVLCLKKGKEMTQHDLDSTEIGLIIQSLIGAGIIVFLNPLALTGEMNILCGVVSALLLMIIFTFVWFMIMLSVGPDDTRMV